jgi:hypothetical protein
MLLLQNQITRFESFVRRLAFTHLSSPTTLSARELNSLISIKGLLRLIFLSFFYFFFENRIIVNCCQSKLKVVKTIRRLIAVLV